MREYTITCQGNDTILETLRKKGIVIPSRCNGNHTCGDCKVRLLYGDCTPDKEECEMLTAEEINDGIRLACICRPKMTVRIEILPISHSAAILTDSFSFSDTENFSALKSNSANQSVFAAFDLGTTTIAAKLIKNGQEIYTTCRNNSQCIFGADVVSRSEASIKGEGNALMECIRTDINSMIKEFPFMPELLIFAGNTTIIHTFYNYPLDEMVKYPFKQYVSGWHEDNYVTDEGYVIASVVMPDIFAYIGGDFVSGLYYCDYYKNEEINLFIDLGTNGEMAIGNRNRILVASAAAGPAFEGTKLNVATDVIKCMATLRKQGIIDESGLLKDPYFETGYSYELCTNEHSGTNQSNEVITITQQDIRNFQMAKAAIRAGIDLLISKYENDSSAINKLYIAGGMGHGLDILSAVEIGLIPQELKNKVVSVGNSSLAGCIKLGNMKLDKNPIEKLRDISEEIVLSNEPNFQELYFEYMMF